MKPLLDFDTLTAPIPGERPAGSPLPGDVVMKIQSARREFEPHPTDPSQPDVPKKPDWAIVRKLTEDALTKSSKDMKAAWWLTEALTKQKGFQGLRDGLTLVRRFVIDCWDRFHPLMDDPTDVDARVNLFQYFCDSDSGAFFPLTIRTIPLIKVRGMAANLNEIRDGKVGEHAITADSVQAAQPVTPSVIDEVAACVQEIAAIDEALTAKMADQAPNISALVQVITECQTLLGRLSPATAEAEPAPQESGGQADASATEGTAKSAGRSSSRADAYRQLGRLADDLAVLEPHSPIPDLLRWAVKLGSMPFRELIQELVREPAVLADIRRQLGIRDGGDTPPAPQ